MATIGGIAFIKDAVGCGHGQTTTIHQYFVSLSCLLRTRDPSTRRNLRILSKALLYLRVLVSVGGLTINGRGVFIPFVGTYNSCTIIGHRGSASPS